MQRLTHQPQVQTGYQERTVTVLTDKAALEDEIARLDREWAARIEKWVVTDAKWGTESMVSKTETVVSGVVFTLVGVAWTVVMSLWGPGGWWTLPGIACTLLAAGLSVIKWRNAAEYQTELAQYEQRRAELVHALTEVNR